MVRFLSRLSSLLLTAVLCVTVGVTVSQPAAASAAGVLVKGTDWLQGQGVDVMGNGGNTGTYWQCVELPQMRLYPKFGWPRVYAAGNGGAAYIPEGSPGLTRYNPGSGYVPVPGDLIIENQTSKNVYGHVAVVDRTEGNTIYAVEQNGSSTGRHNYTYNGSNYAGGGGTVKAVMHAPQNNFKNPGVADSSYDVAFQANTHNLWAVGSAQFGDLKAGMMARTSPSIVSSGNGGYEMAFQANTGNLWAVGATPSGDLKLGMRPGTSPSIARLSTGGYLIAFQANTGNLWVVGIGGARGPGDMKFGMAGGTSPSITALSSGGYEVAFQANTGNLWTVGNDMRGDWKLGMAGGTSPSITTLSSGGYEVAFQANTGNLWTVGNDMRGDWKLGMAAGSSPCISTSGGGSCVSSNPRLKISRSKLDTATVGASYGDALGATGGYSTVTWSVTSGTLPNGLALSPSGAISGIPRKIGSYKVTFQVKDRSGQSARKTIVISVVAESVRKITLGAVVVKGVMKAGKKVRAKCSWKAPDGALVKYQWYRGKKAIKGATKATYKLSTKAKGKKIKVRVTISLPGYTTVSKMSKATKKVR